MDKKTIAALVLVLVIIGGWPKFVKFFAPESYDKIYKPKKKIELQKDASVINADFVEQKEFALASVSVNAEEESVFLQNEELKLEISNIGGVLKQAVLLNYIDKEKNPEVIVAGDFTPYSEGVLGVLGPQELSNLVFKIESVSDTAVRLQAVVDKNLVLIKEYSLGEGFSLDYKVAFKNVGREKLTYSLGYKMSVCSGVGAFKEGKKAKYKYMPVGTPRFYGVRVLKDELNKKAASYKKNKKEMLYEDAYWVAQYSKYFCFILKPHQPISNIYIEEGRSTVVSQLQIRRKGFNIEPGQEVVDIYSLYLGPKKMPVLEANGYHFDKIIDYGMFNFIGTPLLWLLNFFFGLFKNYGIAIILLTITIKIVLHPLTHKSFKSMKTTQIAMQKIKPQIDQLKAKYKNDPQRMHKETMALYKKNKVSPLSMGGCFPMLLQMPVFFALFMVLQTSIELRQAPFMLWITDLAAKDPYYVLPLLMGASMFLQQKTAPSAMDPQQQKMAYIMPIMFTFLFMNFPSGLVLYWLVNNIITGVHQYVVHKKLT